MISDIVTPASRGIIRNVEGTSEMQDNEFRHKEHARVRSADAAVFKAVEHEAALERKAAAEKQAGSRAGKSSPVSYSAEGSKPKRVGRPGGEHDGSGRSGNQRPRSRRVNERKMYGVKKRHKFVVPLVILLAAVFIALVAYIFSRLKPYLPKMLFYPMFLYLLINGTMNCFAVFRYVSIPTAATLTTCIGAVLFFISDSTLFFVRFKKDSRLQTHFWVMLTYSVGELLIILGLLS